MWGYLTPYSDRKVRRIDMSFRENIERETGISLPTKMMKYGLIAVLFMTILFSSCYRVSEGERGVLTRFGKFVGVVDPGINFKVPIMHAVTKMEIRNMTLTDDVHVYSSDTQQYTAKITINYDLDPGQVENIFKREGVSYAERRLRPLALTEMKEVAGKFNAQRTIQERDVFGVEVRDAIKLVAMEYGINVTQVQVQNIDFTDQFEQAIEKAMLAKAKVEEEKSILDQKRIQAETVVVTAMAEANAQREKAKGEADAKVTQADAEARRIAQIGLAEANAIRQKSEALRSNPELTNYTYALAAGNWDGKLPTQFVPGSALPILTVGTVNGGGK